MGPCGFALKHQKKWWFLVGKNNDDQGCNLAKRKQWIWRTDEKTVSGWMSLPVLLIFECFPSHRGTTKVLIQRLDIAIVVCPVFVDIVFVSIPIGIILRPGNGRCHGIDDDMWITWPVKSRKVDAYQQRFPGTWFSSQTSWFLTMGCLILSSTQGWSWFMADNQDW